MTRLYNLESYPELCAYTNLYETEIISSPAAYKSFLDKYKKQGYSTDSIHPQELTIEDEASSLQHLGIKLSEHNNSLYVVADKINSLALRSFLKPGEQYIYRSVYHYWNYPLQIANNVDLNKSAVIIDLNSLSNDPYCSLQFSLPQNSPYPIPIIDNRREVESDFKLFIENRDVHNNIYFDLARKILELNFSPLEKDEKTIKHLKSYLQKIEYLKLIQSQSDSDYFTIIAEIYYREKIYYKSVTLEISLLEDIIINRIDTCAIANFTRKYLKYSFILVSDYNWLPKFREVLNNNNVFIPNLHSPQFSQIWLEKQQDKFPLFGQYLDRIKFQIQRKGEMQWIEVLSTEEQEHIYYEGDSETKQFIARIQETGQDYFELKAPHTILPIQINDRDYCIDGITQEYKIKHPLSELEAQSEELKVRIEFIIKLGSIPELKVTDKNNKYTIEAKLCDRVRQSFNCIPLKTILENRRQRNSLIPNSEKCQQFIEALSPVQNINNIGQAINFQTNIESALRVIHRTNSRNDLFLYIDSHHSSIEQLKVSLQQFNDSGMLDILILDIQENCNERRCSNQNKHQNFIRKLIIFIGKTYTLSSNLNLESFFDPLFIRSAYQKVGNEYFLFLSRVALTEEFQLSYFRLFDRLWDGDRPLYKLEKYLWGYSRILLWYFNFNSTLGLDYKEHFRKILAYLLTGLTQSYKQNAFLALIYLLTFRETDSNFCVFQSEEYQLAEQVVNKYKLEPVRMNAIPDRPLNEYFEALLKGNSSQNDIYNLFEV